MDLGSTVVGAIKSCEGGFACDCMKISVMLPVTVYIDYGAIYGR